MPKKIRELKKILRKAGFQEIPGKGSHTNWIHPLYSGKVTISGQARMRQSVARRDLPLSEAAMAVTLKLSCDSSYNGRNTRNGLSRYQERETKQAVEEVNRKRANG